MRTFLPAVLSGALLYSGVCAHAQEPQQVSSHKDWDVYVLETGGSRICYMASVPTSTKPDFKQRGGTWVLVSERPREGVKDEVSVIAGYEYEPGTTVDAIVDSEKYQLFTEGDGAWLRTREEEEQMVQAMRKGKRLSVVGYSKEGLTTTDEYSLFGFTAAHRALEETCE